ncbi:hypothetical protein IFM89_027630 [Coptis chinensis]|uniref:Uncharacterized protein n=1 Tax=Coptis chinensis TaxID=261450 RepID=A0A835MFE4_9MAGN|nr:hypothetical protein IFM89_027630 [Coptis chinensis]
MSIERLEAFYDDIHLISFSIIGGDLKPSNYNSNTTLHEKVDEPEKTIVVESYRVDVPDGSTKDDTDYFVSNIIRWNLESLACVAESMVSAS